jgi:hypothetical protein
VQDIDRKVVMLNWSQPLLMVEETSEANIEISSERFENLRRIKKSNDYKSFQAEAAKVSILSSFKEVFGCFFYLSLYQY